ncbi:uncharacterized protein LACBIDRAFT_302370 [Laccaria bicolor S238N-H82]|uniref:Predicted protein n=1 Tax=Laccaria bicolor (strain S238N-H82 / ATCC MYA-4686) TaxID=486041 RepID=B0E404_LACBS|nr:uncharacterized protein LACBIDRAFT_302370 [Laccaria bicolor S238N-H82]EDQ98430.1 predicted protein [Laccaria bicolor S238N-H82]|eukprot:XP_001890923.1 predicted protein [Laccaria bicolor S238N-H82]
MIDRKLIVISTTYKSVHQRRHTESRTVSLSTHKELNANDFFSNTDLLLKIFDYLLWDDDDELINSDNAIACKHALAQAAVTCKTLDRLWCSLDTLFPLLKLLPSFIQCKGTYVLRGPTDWSRFDFYANRVKNFSYIRDPDHLDIALHVYFRIAQLLPSPILLPSLQYIRCPSISSNDFLISGICLSLSPSLVAVEIREITSVEDKLCGTFLYTLLNDGAELVKIILRGEGLGKESMALIPRFEKLRVLELGGMGDSLSLPWLERVGALSALTDLDLDFIDSPILPLAKTVGFKHLRSLSISASLPFILSFVVNISTDQLDTFVCLSPPEPGFDMKLLFEDVVSRWPSSLRCFGLRLTPEDTEAEEKLPLDTLKPLFPLHNLRMLSLRGYLMDISDDLMEEWAKTWQT